MGRIISISREFGSGGRQIGKKLAEKLSVSYLDKEIIHEISKETDLSPDYLEHYSESNLTRNFPITIGRSFGLVYNMLTPSDAVYKQQREVMKRLVSKNDCVIIGRCSDYILRDFDIIRVFIYADMKDKIARCREYGRLDENLNDNEMERKIHKVDKERKEYYEYYTSQDWGDVRHFDLCINTSRFSLDEAVNIIAEAYKDSAR